MVGYRRLRPLVAAGSGDCEGDSRHTCMAVAQVAQRNPRGLRDCDGLSAWRARACSPGYHLSGLQPGGDMRRRPYAVMAARHAIPGLQPGVSSHGLSARRGHGASPLRWDGCSACDPRPAAWGIISRAFSPAGAWGVALTGLGWLLGMRARAFSPGYQVTGFQPGGPGKRGMRSQACSPGYHLSGFQPGGPGKRGMRSQAYSPGYHLSGFQPGGDRNTARFPIEALKGRHVIT